MMKKIFDISLLSSKKRHQESLIGIEPSNVTRDFIHLSQKTWTSSWANHLQVISPGRSGTRWLANIILEISQALVIHTTPQTLAEVGYLFSQSLISSDEALGAYRYSRAAFIELANQSKRPLIDLDCKNSPLAPVIMKHYSHCKFIILIRDPISFIRSGLSRGYFLTQNPQAWGHLESDDSYWPKGSRQWQIYKIAIFWKEVARIADAMISQFPSKTYTLNAKKMFQESAIIHDFLDFFEIEHIMPSRANSFRKKVNETKKTKFLSADENNLLESHELYSFCMDGLSEKLKGECGW